MQDVAVQMQALDEFVTRARSQNEAHFEAFTKNLTSLTETVRESYSHLGAELQGITDDTGSFGDDISAQTSRVKDLLDPFTSQTRKPLSELRSNIEAAPLREYVPTGETPKKRPYEYPSTLPRTRPHEEILSSSLSRSVTRKKNPSRTPLGEKEVHSPNKHVVLEEQPTDPKTGVFGKQHQQQPFAASATANSAYAHKIFFGTNIAAYTGVPVKTAGGGGRGEDEDDEEDEQPPLKRTRSQRLAAKGRQSTATASGRENALGPITIRKRSR